MRKCNFGEMHKSSLNGVICSSGEARRVAPSVDIHSCHRLLRRSVATICAHVGYDGESNLTYLQSIRYSRP